MKRITIILLALMLSGCYSPKKILYFQDAELDTAMPVELTYENNIQKDDILAITVESIDKEAAKPFNKELPIQTSGSNIIKLTDRGYLVDSDGYIYFPVLGKMYVLGMTKSELGEQIRVRLIEEGYLKDPVVTVVLLNFKFSVLGESGRKDVFRVDSERLTLIEALSMAGDLNIVGDRSIMVIREEDGMREMGKVDLTSVELLQSPYYYIHPNDVIYIEPNKSRINQSADRQLLPLVISTTSMLLTILALIL